MNELQDKIETEVITRTFQVSGMPLSVFKEVDEFCKSNFGDSRWTMIATLVKAQKEDYKFAMLFDKIESLQAEIEQIKLNGKQLKEQPVKIKTFGKKGDENE